MTKYFGYDPGGTSRGGNGVALITVGEDGRIDVESASLKSPTDAISWFLSRREGVQSIGIDTMLMWAIGDRRCDAYIRRQHSIKSGTVQTLGSLRGAMLGYGILVARKLGLHMVEANPKAAIKAGIVDEFSYVIKDIDDEDARDAVVGAIAAMQWHTGSWRKDLYHDEVDPFFPIGPAVYPWPEVEV